MNSKKNKKGARRSTTTRQQTEPEDTRWTAVEDVGNEFADEVPTIDVREDDERAHEAGEPAGDVVAANVAENDDGAWSPVEPPEGGTCERTRKRSKRKPCAASANTAASAIAPPNPARSKAAARPKPESTASAPAQAPSAWTDGAPSSDAAIEVPADALGNDTEPQPPPTSTMPSMEDFVAELGRLGVPDLVKRHVEMLGRRPRIKNRVWLQRKLAWHEQTRRFGGLSIAAKKRLDELMGEVELPVPTSRSTKATLPSSRSADELPLGARLERKWRDRLIVATRVEAGWECEGVQHRTLSAAAKAVSGTHCSGPAFFGLRPRKDGAR